MRVASPIHAVAAVITMAAITIPVAAQPLPPDINTTIRPQSPVGPRMTPAPVPSIPPTGLDHNAPSQPAEVVSPPGGMAPSGPVNSTPYSAGPSTSGIVPSIGMAPNTALNNGAPPGTSLAAPQ